MKKCTYCGKEYPDAATVCELDAEPLVGGKGTNAAPLPKAGMTWLDRLFTDSSRVSFWGADARLFWGIIGVLGCKHPTARKNAWRYFGWQIAGFVLVFIIIVLVKNPRGK